MPNRASRPNLSSQPDLRALNRIGTRPRCAPRRKVPAQCGSWLSCEPGGGHRKRNEERHEEPEIIHTSRSSKGLRPNSPSSLVDWPSSHPIHTVVANNGKSSGSSSKQQHEDKPVNNHPANPYAEAFAVRVLSWAVG